MTDDVSISRREFLRVTSAAAIMALGGPALVGRAGEPSRQTAADLPGGSGPPALDFSHFPDRLHAFVWRNWSLVPADRMARVIGASRGDIVRLGRAMGLPRPPRISRDLRARSYITVIKRNWHLLPYEQLLQLLEWTPDQLAYTLREDDFLFIKLGSLKPKCEPLRYQAPGPDARTREREIARIVREETAAAQAATDPLFGFVRRLSAPAPTRPAGRGDQLRYCYSYFALYGDPLLEAQADPYPEGLLARLSAAGVTGVWLQAVLYKLAVFPWDPALSKDSEKRLANLGRLVERAARHGIRVMLYLNEPRAMPLRFFERHPEIKGATQGDHAALCTSTAEVRRYLSDAVATVCRAVPALGGLFTITASENFTNCWSHGGGGGCPRCARRPAAEVIADVNRAFAEGIRAAGSGARLIAWDWGWDDAWAGDAIRALPPEVSLMSVSEWRLPVERGGVKTEVGEYSISSVGPGPRATEHWRVARERGLTAVAKVQAGNTWELSAVPYIPAVANVARHAENLARAGVRDFMLGWTLGGYPSPNLEAFSETLACGSAEEAMLRVAERRFGAALAPAVVRAWKAYSTAFSEFPYHIGVVYSGPQQVGPANLLWDKPTGYRATMVGFPYDDLDAWRSVYPPEVFIGQLEKVADGFDTALRQLEASARGASITRSQRSEFEGECRVAEAAAIHFRSAANQARFILARRAPDKDKPQSSSSSRVEAMREALENEITLARRLYALQKADSRLGFEASNQYYYVPLDLLEKILNCRHLLARKGPGSA